MWDLKAFGSSIAVIDDAGIQTTYTQLAEYTDTLAEYVPENSLVFNLCENSLGSIVGYITWMNHHIVPLMLDRHIDRELLSHFLEVYQPDYLWVPAAQAAQYSGQLIFTDWQYALIQCHPATHSALHPDLALLLTTSGSTGSPKLVRLSHQNVLQNTASIISYLSLDASERPITTLPMHYSYGLSVINSHLRVGAAIILTDKTIMQRDFWDMFSAHHSTSLSGVPYTYEMLNKLMFFRRDLPSLRTMTQAGGRLHPDLHQKFAAYAKESGKKFVVMYGATEATARMGYLPADQAADKLGSMGIAVPGGKFSLIDAEGQQINESEVAGELVYEGLNVSLGYAETQTDLSKGDERHGLLNTGDIAKRDADGYYYIVGRKKRFLKLFGNRIGLDETERLIQSYYPDISCACTGKDDAMFVFITDAALCQEIQQFLSEKTKLNMKAFHVKYMPELPKSESGKIRYNELEQYCD